MIASTNENLMKGIQKLETIGKKGKLSKIIKITIEHFEHFKNSMNNFSLKILAYIIKGFFLTIKKSYENFYRELDNFIDINIKGNSRPVKKKEPKEKEASEEIFTIGNLSLYSENTQFEKFLSDTNMTQKINKTLKEINKKFSHSDFSTMTEEKKKEYLRKNFIQPLTDSLPSNDYFGPSSIESCININENFASYIDFDLKTITEDLVKKPKVGEVDHFNNFNESVENLNVDFDFEKIQLGNKITVKNPNFKMDAKIEGSVALHMTEEDVDPFEIFYKHYKKVVVDDQLLQFKKNLVVNERNHFLENLLVDHFETLDENEGKEDEKFRQEDSHSTNDDIVINLESCLNPIQHTPQAKTKKVIEDLYSSTSVRNVFGSSWSYFAKNQSEDKNIQKEENANGILDLDFGDNLATMGPLETNRLENILRNERILVEEENNRLINSEIQTAIERNFNSKKNFEEFKLDNLTKDLKKEIDFKANTNLRTQSSLTFYNMLMVCQNKQLSLKQNGSFKNLYIVKV